MSRFCHAPNLVIRRMRGLGKLIQFMLLIDFKKNGLIKRNLCLLVKYGKMSCFEIKENKTKYLIQSISN